MNEMDNTSDYDSDCSASTTYSEFVGETPKKKYKCTFDKCEKSFFRPGKLEIHQRTHTGEKPFQCKICDKAFHRIELMKKHLNEVHLKKIEYTECPEEGCGMKLRQSSLRKHLLRVHNEFRKWTFQCEICRSGFRSKNELANHMVEHSILFRCEYCGRQFKRGSLYKKHLKCHVERECKCGLKFYENAMFLAHKRSCTFSKPTCEICEKKFANPGNLKDHMNNVHNETENVFKCTVEGCPRQYQRKKSLKDHLAKSHNKKEVEQAEKLVCEICNLIVKNDQNLWRHIKHVHMNANNKIKQLRKPRCDKNKPKVPILTQLTGFKHKEPNIQEQNAVEKPNILFICIQKEPCNGEDVCTETSLEISN